MKEKYQAAPSLREGQAALEKALGKTAEKQLRPPASWRHTRHLRRCGRPSRVISRQPATTVEVGIKRFVAWYRDEFKLI